MGSEMCIRDRCFDVELIGPLFKYMKDLKCNLLRYALLSSDDKLIVQKFLDMMSLEGHDCAEANYFQ